MDKKQEYVWACGNLYLHVSTKLKVEMSLENLVPLAVLVVGSDGWSLSSVGFSVVLKSPSQTACIMG